MTAHNLVGKLVRLEYAHASWTGLVVAVEPAEFPDEDSVLIYRCETPHSLMRWYDLDLLRVLQ